jgi:hypothetical protein
MDTKCQILARNAANPRSLVGLFSGAADTDCTHNQYSHVCSCGHKEERDGYEGCSPGAAICPFCGYVWRSAANAALWFGDGF